MKGVTKYIYYACDECGNDYETRQEAKECYDDCIKEINKGDLNG